MARNWLQIEVVLLAGRGEAFDLPPGRIFLTGGTHTFGDLARAIDGSFGRWQRTPERGFELADGRLIGVPTDVIDDPWLDETQLVLAEELAPGETCLYTFDFGGGWQHDCHVAKERIDPRNELGEVPVQPTPVWGWGTLPDQNGRLRPDD